MTKAEWLEIKEAYMALHKTHSSAFLEFLEWKYLMGKDDEDNPRERETD